MSKFKVVSVLSSTAVFVAVAFLAYGGGVAQAAPAPAGHVTPFAGVFNPIRNVGNNKCLQPVVPVEQSGVVQEPCDGSTLQGWQFVSLGSNHYRFVNQASGACLSTFSPPPNNGDPIGLQMCRNVSNLEFNAGTSLPNVVVLESREGFVNTGFCLDVPGASSQDGLQMQIFQCNGTLAQRWVVGFA